MNQIHNIPDVKLGLIAVSRDCFVISLSERRRAEVAAAYAKKGGEIYECKVTVENELDMLKAVAVSYTHLPGERWIVSSTDVERSGLRWPKKSAVWLLK